MPTALYLWSGFTVGSEKKSFAFPALFLLAACQLGLFTPVVSWIPKQCGIAWNYTSVLSGAFLLPTLLAGTPLQFLERQLLWQFVVTKPLCASTPEELSGTTSMLGNWLSSRTALWVILSRALVRSIFSMAFQWGEGPGIGQSLENRNRMPSVGVKCPLSLLSQGDHSGDVPLTHSLLV